MPGNDIIQIANDGPGKMLDAASYLQGARTVYAQAGLLVASDGSLVFPAAAALGDGMANPTASQIGSMGLVWNGTTWERQGSTGGAGHVVEGTPSTRQNVNLFTAAAGVAPTATDALLSLSLSRNNAAGAAAATSNALTTNKVFRITSLSMTVTSSTTTAVRVSATLRFNAGGAVTTALGALSTFVVASPAAVANVGNAEVWTFPGGMDIPAGPTPGQIGVSILGSAATGLCWVTINGYEY